MGKTMKFLFIIYFSLLFCQSQTLADDSAMVQTMVERLDKINQSLNISELDFDTFHEQLLECMKPIKEKTATKFDYIRYHTLVAGNPKNFVKATNGNQKNYLKSLATKTDEMLLLMFGYNNDALQYYDQAIVYFEAFLKQSRNENLKREVALKTAQIKARTGRYNQSLSILNSLIRDHSSGKGEKNRDFLNRVFQYKAVCLRSVGNLKLAEETYRGMLALVSDKGKPHHIAEIKNQLALFFLETGRVQESLENLNDSLEQLKPVMPEATSGFHNDLESYETVYTYAITTQYLGLLLHLVNQPESAEIRIKESIRYLSLLSSDTDNPAVRQALAKVRYSECYAHNLLGDFYMEQQKDQAAALESFTRALKISENINYQRGKINALGGLAGIEIKEERYDQALTLLKDALSILDTAAVEGDVRPKIPILIGIADALEKKSEFKAAVMYLEQAVKICIENNIILDLWRLNNRRAKISWVLGDFKNATANFDRAIHIIENTRSFLPGEQIKYSYMKDKFFVYDDFIEFLNIQHKEHPGAGFDKKAFELFEKKQARIFLEKTGKSFSEKSTNVPSELIYRKESLEEENISIANRLAGHNFLTRELKAGGGVDELKAKRAENKIEIEKIVKKIKTLNPRFYRLRYPQPLTLENIQTQLLKPDELLLVYHVSGTSSILWAVARDHFAQVDLSLTRKKLAKNINRLYHDLKYENVTNFDDSLDRFKGNSMKLAQRLIPLDVARVIKNKKHLLVVPTKELYKLPFETLVMADSDGKEHYLIQDLSVSYLSSAALLSLLPAENRTEKRSDTPLLAFGNPDYGGEDASSPQSLKKQSYLKTSRAGSKSRGFRPLPDSESEIYEIAKSLGVDKTVPVLNFGIRASESRVLELNRNNGLMPYQYLIFGCHGILPGDTDGINEPAIVLTQPDPEASYDGFLTMTEVFGLRMNADLTLLSACNTGSGTLYDGEGIRGMARAFMYAGSQTVAMNLWPVDSRRAGLHSVDFFTCMGKGLNKSAALRRAKLNMINGTHGLIPTHPFFWGAMVLFGDGR